MQRERVCDLTVGAPMKLLINFTVPLMLGMLFQQFYSMVDTIVVGKILGTDALAGVGSTSSVNFLVLGFCMGICSGFAIPVAQKFGQRDEVGLRRFIGNILWLGIGTAVVMTVVTTVLCRDILIWMKTPAETFAYAYQYISIIFLGIPAAMLYNTLSGILRSLGDSKTPLFFLILSSLLNVGLDLLLTLVVKLGVAGTAIATVLTQLISGMLCLLLIARRFPILHLQADDLRFRFSECRQLLSMGLPMGLQYSITAIGSVLLQTAVNNLGTSAMAAVTAGDKLSNFLMIPHNAIGSAAATYAGQNAGAGQFGRIRQGVRACAILGVLYSVTVFLLVCLFGRPALMLFLDSDAEEALILGQQYLRIHAAFFVALLFVNLLRFTIQGMGFSGYAVIAGVLEMVARGTLAITLVPSLGFLAVCLGSPAAWILADLFLFPLYFYALNRLHRAASSQNVEFHCQEVSS